MITMHADHHAPLMLVLTSLFLATFAQQHESDEGRGWWMPLLLATTAEVANSLEQFSAGAQIPRGRQN